MFDVDETDLFFECLPDNTLMIGEKMDGSEEHKLFLIGKSNAPKELSYFLLTIARLDL